MTQVTVVVVVQILSGSVGTGPNSILLVELEILLQREKERTTTSLCENALMRLYYITSYIHMCQLKYCNVIA